MHQGPDAEVLPHVYTSTSMTGNNVLSSSGSKYILPIGTERKYFEVRACSLTVVHTNRSTGLRRGYRTSSESRSTQDLGEVDPMLRTPPLGETVFSCEFHFLDRARSSHMNQGYQTLNRIQSIVYPTAFGTNENMLICGA